MMGALTTCGLLLSYISGTARRLSILFSYPNGQLKEHAGRSERRRGSVKMAAPVRASIIPTSGLHINSL